MIIIFKVYRQKTEGDNEKVLFDIYHIYVHISFCILQPTKDRMERKIEFEDGVKVVKNPGKHLYVEITFNLEENLSIGREEDENYMFYRAYGIAVDKQGNIYVVDRGNDHIQVYDNEGQYLIIIGKLCKGDS